MLSPLSILSALCLLSAASALSELPCDDPAADICTISTPQTLSADTYQCTKDGLIIKAPVLCDVANSAKCGFQINVTGDVKMDTGGALLAAGGPNYPLEITAGGTIDITGGTLTGSIIHLTSTLISSAAAGVSCSQSFLNAAGLGDTAIGPGTPLVPGTRMSYGGARGLGAAHAGAGATGYDSTPSSLYAASRTYPASPFDLPETPDVFQLLGSLGGLANVSSVYNPNPVPGQGGGLVWLTATTSKVQLNKCVLVADGGVGYDAGGGSGGSVIVDGASISITSSTASANGGAAVSTVASTACSNIPCGLPGGGGFVYARSDAAAPGSITPLLSWGAAMGGNTSVYLAGPLPGLCGGAGLLVDCQGNGDEDTDCDVGIVQTKVCSSVSAVAAACFDGGLNPPQTSTACLMPPTELACGDLQCGALHLASGANLTLSSGGVLVNRTITASDASFSSGDAEPLLSARLGVTLTNSIFSAPSDDTPKNYTVASTESTLFWAAQSMSLYGSLSISAGLGLTTNFVGVNITAANSFLANVSCAYLSWQGALTLAGGMLCTPATCPSGSPMGRVTFTGSMQASTFGAYAYTDVDIGNGAVVSATGCLPSSGPGFGSIKTITGGSAAGTFAGGGGGHHGVGGDQGNSLSPRGGGGAPYDVNPFAIYPPVPVGGSGGGGDATMIGGRGGGTIVLAGNGTLRANGGAEATLSAAGGAGLPSATGLSGGGSGGTVVLAFSSFDESKTADANAMAALKLSAAGGSVAASSFSGVPVCAGGGSGGNVIVAVPMSASALPRPPSVNVGGGAASLPCATGAPGLPMFTRLPAPPSNTMTATASGTASATATMTSSSSATSTSTSSPTTSSSSSGSASFSPSAAPSAAPSPSSNATASASASATATSTSTTTQAPSLSTTNSLSGTPSSTSTSSISATATPAPQILGLKVPYFIAATTAGGALFLAVFIWILVKTACAPAVKGAMLVPSSPAGSLWSSTNASASGDRMGLLSNGADEDWGGGSAYVPPSGVV